MKVELTQEWCTNMAKIEARAEELHEGCQMPMEQAQELAASEMSEGRKALLAAFGAAAAAREQGLRGQYPKAATVLAEEVFSLRAALRQKHAEYEDLKRCAANNTRNQGLKIETLLRGINDARALIDPIWRHRMGAEQVREHVQRGLRCIDSAITDCRFTAPTAVHASDCAMHNAPAYPAGECDCGALGPNVAIKPRRQASA